MRRRMRDGAAQGTDWHAAIDALRPMTAGLWQGFRRLSGAASCAISGRPVAATLFAWPGMEADPTRGEQAVRVGIHQ